MPIQAGIPSSFGKVPFTDGPTHYFVLCLFWALAVRGVALVFIALSKIKDDPIRCEECGHVIAECPKCHGRKRSWKGKYFREFWRAYLYCWWGLSARERRHYDLWLPFFVGFAELAAYPILLAYGQFQPIGWWIAIRTAGSWTAWKSERTVFYRFLLGMILNIAIAYVFLSSHIRVS
jgi:hypothetical protein